MQKEFEELKQQYGVTVKVVKAQGEYINDLETKNLASPSILRKVNMMIA